jgi:hypothetical protein
MKASLKIIGLIMLIAFVWAVIDYREKQIERENELLEQMKYATDQELEELEKLIEIR